MTLPRIRTGMKDDEGQRLAELAQGRTILEVGAWFGYSTVVMGKVARVVHSVDWHRGDDITRKIAGYRGETLPALWQNVCHYGVRDKVVLHVGSSDEVLPLLVPRSFDFAFHDSFHSTERVAADAAMIVPLLIAGSLLAFHDYGRYGVKAAVDALGLPVVSLTRTLIVVQL